MSRFRYTKGSKILVNLANKILDEVEGNQIKPGIGIRVKKSVNGTLLDVTPTEDDSTLPDPFQVTVRANPSDPSGSTFQAKVNLKSNLLLSLKPSDNLTITGLDSWFLFIATDVIWLYITVVNYAATVATIQSYGLGNSGFTPTLNAWDDTGGYVQDDGGSPPSQIAANILIAYSFPDDAGNPVLTQTCRTDLLIENCAIAGRAAIFAYPAPYGRFNSP